METKIKTYTPAIKITPKRGDVCLANIQIPCRIVADHFAIRPIHVQHPAGGGLLCEVYQLDHTPSGLRVHSGHPLDPKSERECEAMARSLESLGDWSTDDPFRTPDVDKGWMVSALSAARSGEYIDANGDHAGVIPDTENDDEG